ncbi:glycoside hydrolase family 2 protein [Cohnella silvisoli]|uniref:Glycoside hydrolase family 2 TIM barrel-domain containing protein n=1 Tax=Cohnella silvisoli TaxID=2873699 RepID=A0ABV1KL06_9BACL|nr:sugar-binding domain-containing protein [Cohnella silvisoli]MCD9020834.1 glycoside hydrolase family 2 [Cohnella silvisoli]
MTSAQSSVIPTTTIPKPEHPRPDWQRSSWLNLNGEWGFRFDADNLGLNEQWQGRQQSTFNETIVVPFSWVSPLSGIGDNRKGIAWYSRNVRYADIKTGERLFLHFGAVDYSCTAWVNGQQVGTHTGGYGAFAFDVTEAWQADGDNHLVVRAEDQDAEHQTRGKQGYGEIRGIWQTVWLEVRPCNYVDSVRIVTKLDGTIAITGSIQSGGVEESTLIFEFDGGSVRHEAALRLNAGDNKFSTSFQVLQPRLWSPEDPHLYEGTITLKTNGSSDTIATYFGIREIGSALFDDRSYRWITLNRKPVYLNGTLDQAFYPVGHFTAPSDEELQDEIWRLKRLGLNLVRIHIKPEEPRKLYWADKLGIMVMEDMPCFWGEPDEAARTAYEAEAREILNRDYNHPSIVSWVIFNETWGLFTTRDGVRSFRPETQEWVRNTFRWAKSEDPTRIIEDNSPCNWDHVETDLNTWHFYKNGYKILRDHVQEVVDKTFPGSDFNYIGGNLQTDAPLMNSECGAVWGIEGSAGDSDIAWQYRYMINELRRHDKMCGFVFTEFHDVVNEYNGYYRIDGSDKDFGYDAFVPGMSIADLHSPDFIVIDAPPCETVKVGQRLEIALLRSSYSDRYHGQTLRLEWELWHDRFGSKAVADQGSQAIEWNGYGVAALNNVTVNMPATDSVAVFAVTLRNDQGDAITRNFITFDVRSDDSNGIYDLEGKWLSVPVNHYARQEWPYAWHALNNHKVNGGLQGFVEFEIKLPADALVSSLGNMEIFFEAGAKVVLRKDKENSEAKAIDLDFMSGVTPDPDLNPSTYYMTDESKHPSLVKVSIDGHLVESLNLPDDPADSRGVLSWHYQPKDTKLEEAGSYGYLHKVTVPSRLIKPIVRAGGFTLRLKVDGDIPALAGGLALYGRNAGRYPIELLVRYC